MGERGSLRLDAIREKVRENERVESVAAGIVTGVHSHGRRQVVDFAPVPTESLEGWRRFLTELKESGLHAMRVVVSGARGGLTAKVVPPRRLAKEIGGTDADGSAALA